MEQIYNFIACQQPARTVEEWNITLVLGTFTSLFFGIDMYHCALQESVVRVSSTDHQTLVWLIDMFIVAATD